MQWPWSQRQVLILPALGHRGEADGGREACDTAAARSRLAAEPGFSPGRGLQKAPTSTAEQVPFRISFSSSSMVYLFLLVCFSLNPSITLQCKMLKLLARATSIMSLSLLITVAENS